MKNYELINSEAELYDKIQEINASEFKKSQVAIITNNQLNHPDFEQGEFSGYRPAFCNDEPGLCDFNPNSKVYYKNFASEAIEQFINEFNSYNVLDWGSLIEKDYAEIINGKNEEKKESSIDANDRIDWTKESITKVKEALDNNLYAVFVNDSKYYTK